MKKTKLLSLTALALIGILGLSSCSSQGPKGDKGDQGIQGETGPKGDKGDPGENGEDGEDGATWLTGTTKPADTLGKLGDMYLNTSNGDVYQKEADGWKLKMNIQGEDGEDGKDGHNGSNGSTGPKGDTAWSNTILPSSNGYVIPSVGSGVKGTKFTLEAYPDTNYYLKSLELVDKSGTITTPSYSLDETTNVVVSEEVSMVEGGYVISATFESTSSLGTTGYVDGKKYNGSYDAAGNFVPTTEISDAPKFAGGNGSESDPLQIEDKEQFTKISDSGEEYFVLNQSLEGDNAVSSLPVAKESKNLSIDLGGNNLESNNTIASTVSKNSEVTYKNGTLKANKIPEGHKSVIEIGNGATNSMVTLENIEFETTGTPIYTSAKGSEINVINSTLIGGTYALGTNANQGGAETSPVTINIDGSTLISKGNNYTNTALFINVGADVNVTNSTLQGDRHTVVVRGGDVSLENTTLNYTGYGYTKLSEDDRDDLYDTTTWYQGNGVPTAGIFIGNNESNDYSGKSILTLKSITLSEIDPDNENVGTLTTLSEENVSSKPEKPYLLYGYGESEENNVTINTDESSWKELKEDEGRVYINDLGIKVKLNIDGSEYFNKTNIYVDGKLYEKATVKVINGVYYLANPNDAVNNVLAENSVSYSDGSGTTEDPLIVTDDEQVKNAIMSGGDGLSYEIETDVYLGDLLINNESTLNRRAASYLNITNFEGNLNFKNHKVYVPNSQITYYGFFQKFSGVFENAVIIPEDYTKSTSLFYVLGSTNKSTIVRNVVLGEENNNTIMNVENNESLLCINTSGIVLLENLTNYINYDNGSYYNSPFIGGYALDGNVTFRNVVNNGDLISANSAAAFIGNKNNYNDGMYTFIDCVNNGKIIAPAAGLYVAIAGGTKDAIQKSDASFNGATNNGQLNFVSVEDNVKFKLESNENGTYNLSYSDPIEGASKVVLNLSTYLSYKEGDTSYGTYLAKFEFEVELSSQSKQIELKSSIKSIDSEVVYDENLASDGFELVYDEGSESYKIHVGDGVYNFAQYSYGVKNIKPEYTGKGSFTIRYNVYDENGELIAVSSKGALNLVNSSN